MTELDSLRSWLFRSLMFEAESEAFRKAGVRVGVDESTSENALLEDSLAPFGLAVRNEAVHMARLYALLFCFENAVRDLIRSRLQELDVDWWGSSRVPTRIRNTAESRKVNAEKNSWLEGARSDVLTFVDFGGLADIVVSSWPDFADLIPSQHWLKQRFDEMELARNFIAHNRMLTGPEFARVEMYVSDWNRQVGL